MLQTPRSLDELPEIVCDPTSGTAPEEVATSWLLLRWLNRLRGASIRVERVRIYAAHKFGASPELKMIHLYADAYDAEGNKLPGIATLRGDTVDVLAVLRTANPRKSVLASLWRTVWNFLKERDAEYVVLVSQPRVAGAQRVVSNPSGMIDPDEGVDSAALRELSEETGENTIRWTAPVNMGAYVTGDGLVLVSPGGSDERVQLVLTSAVVSPEVLAQLCGKFGGLSHEGENTTVIVVPLSDALKRLSANGTHADLRTLTSLLLYLRMTGKRA